MVRTARTCRTLPALRGERGFTLIELLVVIVIIVILLAVAFSIGQGVVNSGRERQTQFTLRVLDSALTEYIHSQERLPPAWVVDPRYDPAAPLPPSPVMQPMFDGAYEASGGAERLLDSTALFLAHASGMQHVEAKLRDLDAKLLREVELDLPGLPSLQMMPTVLDGWGNPIRFVHPAFQGIIHGPNYQNAQVNLAGRRSFVDVSQISQPTRGQPGVDRLRRNNVSMAADINGEPPAYPDADGGLAQNRPYFYSTGRSGRVGYLVETGGNVNTNYNADNVYTSRPRFQAPDGVQLEP